MKKLLLRCYPAAWRARYGEEFEALLGRRPLGPFEVADVMLGAVDAHLHFEGLGNASVDAKGFGMTMRLGGYAALWAGILLLFTILGVSTLFLSAATVAVLVATIGLNAAQGRLDSRLAWTPVVLAAVAVVAPLFGWLGLAVSLMSVLLGSALFALGLLRARTLSRRPPALVLAGSSFCASFVALFFGQYVGFLPPLPITETQGYLVLLTALVVFAIGWIGVGLDVLLRELPAARQVRSGKQVA
jgi:hypothetical protein